MAFFLRFWGYSIYFADLLQYLIRKSDYYWILFN